LKCGIAAVYCTRVRRLYLMRHGETLYLGRSSPDGSDLTENGRRQVEAAAELFASVRLDLVVASPMRRARGTASIVAVRHEMTVEPLPALREIAPGETEGMPLGEIFGRVVEFFTSPEVTWDTPFVGGETFRQLRSRVLGGLAGLLARSQWKTALAVAHGGVNMALLSGVLGLVEGEIPRLDQDLGCVNVIDFDEGGRGLVRLVNFSASDPLKDAHREPSAARLKRLLEARARDLAGSTKSP
jgi:broad specificity phosphatase PhoE